MAFPRFWFYRAILKIAGAGCLRYDSNKYAAGPATAYPTTFFLAHRIRSECTLPTQL